MTFTIYIIGTISCVAFLVYKIWKDVKNFPDYIMTYGKDAFDREGNPIKVLKFGILTITMKLKNED